MLNGHVSLNLDISVSGLNRMKSMLYKACDKISVSADLWGAITFDRNEISTSTKVH